MFPATNPEDAPSVSGDPRPHLVSTPRGPVEVVISGDGPAVLALHGAMGGCDQSLLLARTLAEGGYRVLAPSRPGYLGTPLSSGRTAEEQADLHAAMLRRLGLRSAAVVAVSGGGPSALQLALRHPELCWGLVLVSTCSGVMAERIPLRFHLMKLLARIPAFAAMARRQLDRDPEAAAARSIPDPALRARTLADPEAWPLLLALMRSTSDRMGARLAGTDNDIRVTRRTTYPLERIAAPALVVHGTADSVASFDHGAALAARIPGAELLAIEGGEHVSIFTHREVVRERVTKFLREHAPENGA